MRSSPFALVVCLTVATTASAQSRAAALTGWFNLDVPGGSSTLASIRLDDAGLALPLLARTLHGEDSRTRLPVDELNRRLAQATTPTVGGVSDPDPAEIPVPLTRNNWERLLSLKRGEDLFIRLITDRPALLVAAGLTATHDSIRALLTRDDDLLKTIYLQAPAAFSLVARSLQVADGRVVVPGGAGDERIWETLTGVSPAKPPLFIAALLTRDEGRLAWYFDTLTNIDADRFAAAWPAAALPARLAHAQQLYAAFRESEPQWRIERQPYRRGIADAATALTGIELKEGRVAGPMWRWLWQALFEDGAIDARAAARLAREEREVPSLAWFVDRIVHADLRDRRPRYELVRLAQRAFADATEADANHLAVTLSGYRRYRGLVLALERMGIPSAQTWATAVESARRVDEMGGDNAETLAIVQGAIAIVERLRHVRTINAVTATHLFNLLADAIATHGRVHEAVASWIVHDLVTRLPPLARPDKWIGKTAYESSILNALAGLRLAKPPTLEWEGLSYSIDRASAEHDRLLDVREHIASPGLDAALASGNSKALATALTAIIYVIALGDPNGAAVLSGDVPSRHDFGLDSTALVRNMWSWAPPEERLGDGGPWRAHGGLMSLDLGLARLALQRVADQQMPTKPTLTLNDFATFARTAAALVPADMSDADRDEIAAAVARGRERVKSAGRQLDELRALAREARMAAPMRELLPWLVSHQPERIPEWFAVRDLFWLGKPSVPLKRLHAWGVHAGGLDGRQITAMPTPASWEDFTGRSDLGQIATQVPDLTLRLAEETARLKLPAELVPALLAFAVQDYWHDVQARFSDDWLAMVQQAAALTTERVEDYVAALTGTGPLRLVRDQN